MPIISARNNENSRWKRNAKNKDRKDEGGTSYSEKVLAK